MWLNELADQLCQVGLTHYKHSKTVADGTIKSLYSPYRAKGHTVDSFILRGYQFSWFEENFEKIGIQRKINESTVFCLTAFLCLKLIADMS